MTIYDLPPDQGATLCRRVTLVLARGRRTHVFYPVFPPDRNAAEIVGRLEQRATD